MFDISMVQENNDVAHNASYWNILLIKKALPINQTNPYLNQRLKVSKDLRLFRYFLVIVFLNQTKQ